VWIKSIKSLSLYRTIIGANVTWSYGRPICYVIIERLRIRKRHSMLMLIPFPLQNNNDPCAHDIAILETFAQESWQNSQGLHESNRTVKNKRPKGAFVRAICYQSYCLLHINVKSALGTWYILSTICTVDILQARHLVGVVTDNIIAVRDTTLSTDNNSFIGQ